MLRGSQRSAETVCPRPQSHACVWWPAHGWTTPEVGGRGSHSCAEVDNSARKPWPLGHGKRGSFRTWDMIQKNDFCGYVSLNVSGKSEPSPEPSSQAQPLLPTPNPRLGWFCWLIRTGWKLVNAWPLPLNPSSPPQSPAPQKRFTLFPWGPPASSAMDPSVASGHAWHPWPWRTVRCPESTPSARGGTFSWCQVASCFNQTCSDKPLLFLATLWHVGS